MGALDWVHIEWVYLVAHAHSLSRLWHEIFGQLNYMYLQQLSTQKLVHGLPKVSCVGGFCPRRVLGKKTLRSFSIRKFLACYNTSWVGA